MKKSLIALAVLASAGVASAQSSVTLFGVVDVTLSNMRADGAGKINTVRDSGYNSSRVGFRGTEDLGGGMAASFWLEAGFTADNGAGQNTALNNTSAGDRILVGSAAAATYSPQASLGARQGLTFNRRSTVSLTGGFGEVRLGRDYVPSFWNLTVFDPFGSLGVGNALSVSLGPQNPFANSAFAPGSAAPQVRSSNSIGYFLPANLGGFYGQVMYALADQPGNCTQPLNNTSGPTNLCFGAKNDGRYMGGRVGYANGPLNVAFGYGEARYGDTAVGAPLGTIGTTGYANTAAFRGKYKQINVGGQWDFGVAKLMGILGEQRQDATSANVGRKLRHATIGTLVPVGPGEIRLSYNHGRRTDGLGLGSSDGTRINQLAIGYVHNLSKRTALYASAATQRVRAGASGAAGPNIGYAGANIGPNGSGKATGYDFGVRHSF